jgi:hypothetical protein
MALDVSFQEWLLAFALTQLIEVPIYCLAARRLPLFRRLIYAVGGTAITHPIIWFCLPWKGSPHDYIPLLILAETFVFVVEGAWGRLWRVPHPWRASLLANLASFLVGNLVRWLLTEAIHSLHGMLAMHDHGALKTGTR